MTCDHAGCTRPADPDDSAFCRFHHDNEDADYGNPPTTLIAVKDLQPGMFVDLTGDKFSDPDEPLYEFEYAVVDQIELETFDCVRVDFENVGSIGFPPEHMVKTVEVGQA